MALRIDNFRLYVSRSNGAFITLKDYTLLVLVEGAETGVPFVERLPLTRKMMFAYTPKIIRVFNRMHKPNISELRKSYGKGISVLFNLKALEGRSFYYDITPFFHSLKRRLTSVRFAKESLNFFKKVVSSVKHVNKETVLLYYVDESILTSRIREKELYSFMFTYHLRRQITDLGIDKIFLVTSNTVRLIYDRSMGGKNKFTIFLKWVILAMKSKKIITLDDDIADADADEQAEMETLIANKKEIEKELKQDTDIVQSKVDIVSIPALLTKPVKEPKEKRSFFRRTKKEPEQQTSKEIPFRMNKVRITKPTHEKDVVEEKPVIEPEQPVTKDKKKDKRKLIKKSTIKKQTISKRDVQFAVDEIVKNSFSDISRLNVSLSTLMNRVNAYAITSPSIEKEVVKAYVTDDIVKQKQIAKAALVQTDDPEASLINPIVKRENIDKQEETAKKLGFTQVLPIDATHNINTNKKLVKNNIANALARRHGYKDYIKNILKQSLPDMLKHVNYKLQDITFTNISSTDVELYKTELEFINIKCRDSDNRSVTLKFKAPKLTEDRYVLSGGLKWYYPTVLSTLPIFIVKPNQTQFRSNYSAITFNYGIFNRREDIRCYVGGFKIPVGLLLSCLLSVEGLLRTFKFQYMMVDKRQRNANVLNLMLDDGTYLAINKKTDVFSKCLLSGLEQMFRKYRPRNINTVEESFHCLKLMTAQNKSEYILKQVFKFIIDVQTLKVLKAHSLPTDLANIIIYASELAVSGEFDDKLSIQNTYLRTIDIIISAIEKGVHNGIAIYNQQRIYNPSVLLSVNVGFIINFFRENGVLQLLEQQNPIEEVSNYSSVRIVGPGGLPNKDAVQPRDRSMRRSHFGNLDPVDTSEGDPGVRLYLTTGHVYDDKQHSFMPMESNDTNKNVLGLAGSLTPFVDKNDQVRLNMACNQARQALPIVSAETPIVMTGAETIVPTMTSSTFAKRAKQDGTITHIDNNIMIVQHNNNTKDVIDLRPTELKSGSGISSAITHTPSVKVGDKVKANRLLTTNEFLKPVLTQGVNVRCAYLSYLGYNYEDGFVLSESLAKKLTSLHYDTIEIDLTERDKLDIFPAINQVFKKGETVCTVQRNVAGNIALTEDWEIIAPSDLRVVDINVYPRNIQQVSKVLEQIEEAYKQSNDILKKQGLPLLFDKKQIIKNVGKYKARDVLLTSTKIVIKLLRFMPISIGDKLTNRHAAKGVVAHIVPDKLMPHTEDGEHMDVLINSLSVVSRMNLGQIYEISVGKIMYYASKRIADMLRRNKSRQEIENFIDVLYNTLDRTDDKVYSASVMQNLKTMNASQFKKYMFGVANGKIHFIVPPFQSPKLEDVEKAAKHVGIKLADRLYLPEIHSKTKHPVAWGILYLQKLEHISEIKQNVRNLGPYIKTTLEPTRGKARAGGQRMGEMDTWSLLAYDANNVLSDFWLVNADNPDAKKQVLSEIYKSGSANVNFDINRSGSGQMFDSVLTSMGISKM